MIVEQQAILTPSAYNYVHYDANTFVYTIDFIVTLKLLWCSRTLTILNPLPSSPHSLPLSSPPLPSPPLPSPSPPLPLPSPPLPSPLFPSSPLQRKGPAAAEDGEGVGREQLCEGLAGAAAAREVRQQPAPPHREPASEGAGEWASLYGRLAMNVIRVMTVSLSTGVLHYTRTSVPREAVFCCLSYIFPRLH